MEENRVQSRRGRIVLIVGLGLLVCSLIIALFIFYQRSNRNAELAAENAARAETAQVELQTVQATVAGVEESGAAETSTIAEATTSTEGELKIAYANQAAALSDSFRESQLDLALLFSVEGVKLDKNVLTMDSLLHSIQANPTLIQYLHSDYFNRVDFSPDGNLLATGGKGFVQLWNLESEQPLETLTVGTDEHVSNLLFSPDSSLLVAGSYAGKVHLWNMGSRQLLETLSTDDDASISSMVFSPDGSSLTVVKGNLAVQIWNVANGQLMRELPPVWESGYNSPIALSPDGGLLAVAAREDYANWGIWLQDITSGEWFDEPLVGHREKINDLAFSSDSSLLASSSDDDTIRIWDVETKQQIAEVLASEYNPTSGLAFSPDGSLLATGNADSTVQLWDVKSRKPVGAPLVGCTGRMGSVAFSPDGSLLAAVGNTSTKMSDTSGTTCMWQVRREQAVGAPFAGHTDSVNSLAFSPDGSLVASGSSDTTVRLWDIKSGQQVGETLVGHTRSVTYVVFSPDGSLLASGSRDGEIRLWDIAQGQQVGEPLTGHKAPIKSLWFSTDGRLLKSGSGDLSIRLWDVESSQLVEALPAAEGALLAMPIEEGTPAGTLPEEGPDDMLVFSPDGTMFAGDDSSTVRLWDVESGQRSNNALTMHRNGVISIVFSPDGSLLASSGHDKTIRMWDMKNEQPFGEPIVLPYVDAKVVTISPDNRLMAATNGYLRLWDLQTGQPLWEPQIVGDGDIASLAFSPDGSLLATGGGHRDPTIRLWDVDVEAWLPLAEPFAVFDDIVSELVFSPDSSLLVTRSGKTLYRFNVKSGQQVGEPLSSDQYIYRLRFFPDGDLIAGGMGNNIFFWRVENWEQVGDPIAGGGGTAIALSADGCLLASGNAGGEIRLWDVETRQQVSEPLVGHTSTVTGVAFSPDGNTLVSSGYDDVINFWDVASGQLAREPLEGYGFRISTVVFSPDGSRVAWCSNESSVIYLWNVENQEFVDAGPLINHNSEVYGLAFSPDGSVLASASFDGTVRLWDAQTGKQIGEPINGDAAWALSILTNGQPSSGHFYFVYRVAFSPDGKLLASSGEEQNIWLWDVDVESWKAKACQRAGRNLTQAEWQLYFPERPYEVTCPQWPAGE